MDLINAFTIREAEAKVLDPACGGGTFLVRSYARKKYLDPLMDHSQLLSDIYGCDVLQYACHLSTINLAIRDLRDDDNYPRIRRGDYLRFTPGTVFHEQPVRMQAGGLPTGKMSVQLGDGEIDAVVGNPPYIQAKDLPTEGKTYYWRSANEAYPEYGWSKDSDININFWTKSSQLLSPNGMIGLLTQAAWLDVEYGFPLQKWMLDHYKIVAVMETEAETWFTDARVATVVTILAACDDVSQRENNVVRFVQFRRRLADMLTALSDEAGRQSSAEVLRDRILSENSDVVTDDYRVRVIRQAALRQQGMNGGGTYIGSKWGRFLRSLDTTYGLARTHDTSFDRLEHLAKVGRGVTTNCDKFFLVSRITAAALSESPDAKDFQRKYGVARDRVAQGRIAIVRRKDKVDFAIEADRISPILKTGRDTFEFATSRISDIDYVVQITERRNNLSALCRKYVEAAEREEWHPAPSFMKGAEPDDEWYILRDLKTAPILFIKAMQYAPLVYWNDADVLANQRLYMITPEANVDSQALCAVLNSTLFACERYASVKALGREALSDAEVFSVRAFRTLDIRALDDSVIGELQAAMNDLANRSVKPMLEEVLEEAGYNEALAYSEKNPVSPDIWPAELKDETRQLLDRTILAALGIPKRSIKPYITGIYNELTLFNRNRKIVELEAQINRRGTASSESYTVKQFADEIWSELTTSDLFQPRHVPSDFLDDSMSLDQIDIPASRSVERIDTPLLKGDSKLECKIGRSVLQFNSKQHLDYALTLHEVGVYGTTQIPSDERACNRVLIKIKKYIMSFREQVLPRINNITKDPDLHGRILKEMLKRITRHHSS